MFCKHWTLLLVAFVFFGISSNLTAEADGKRGFVPTPWEIGARACSGIGQLTCAPDLEVTSISYIWDNTNKQVTATVENTGNKDATEFYIYFNAEDPDVASTSPPVNEIREQKSFKVDSLSAGSSVIKTATFDLNKVQTVKSVSIIADPKHMVKESDENNNVGSAHFARAGTPERWLISLESCYDSCEQNKLECVLQVFRANPPRVDRPGQPDRAPLKFELPFCSPDPCEPERTESSHPNTKVCNDEFKKCNLKCLLRYHYFNRPGSR